MLQTSGIGLMAAFILAANAGSPSPELGKVIQSLQPVFAELNPIPEIKYSDDGKTVKVAYKTQVYKIHGSFMTGEISKEAHDETGPTYQGFILSVSLEKKETPHQAVIPQTIRYPYWKTDLRITTIARSDEQLYWYLSYGSRTDEALLKKIRDQLAAPR